MQATVKEYFTYMHRVSSGDAANVIARVSLPTLFSLDYGPEKSQRPYLS